MGDPAMRMQRDESIESPINPCVFVCQIDAEFRSLKSRLTLAFDATELPAPDGPITNAPGHKSSFGKNFGGVDNTA